MGALCGITVIKKFTYRGDPNEEWSNTYHFSGAVPADDTAWTALFTALTTAEKVLYSGRVAIVRAYGYATDSDADASVWSKDIAASPILGTATTTSTSQAPGDAAYWVRWKTSRLNTKGKAIYLRKYYHDPLITGTNGGEQLVPAVKTAATAFGTKLMDGSFLDGRTLRSMTHAETLLSTSASTYLTTRTLKRRGKRPGS